MTKAVIFDMNGVFIKDAGPFSLRLAEKYKIPADDIYPLLKSILKEVRVPGSNSRKLWQPILDRLQISYSDFFAFWFEGESLNHDLLQYAKELKSNGTKIIILSNNFPERTSNYRHRFPELFEVVDEQYFSWETGNVKPDPAAFTQIIKKGNLLPSEYVCLDDNDENLASAANLDIVPHKYVGVSDARKFISGLMK